MHNLGWLMPVLIVAMVMATGAFTTWVRAKHGLPLQDKRHRRSCRHGTDDGLEHGRKVALLTTENERLHGQVGRLEDRIAVLERIVTDPAERTAREIDALR